MAQQTTTALNTLPAHIASEPQHIPPAQLWFGPHEYMVARTEEYLQKLLCSNQGCGHCTTCRQIFDKQHHAIMWLYPEKNYTLDEIAGISATISYSLAPDQLYFFIIQKADFLTPACANSLLKSIEEPPAGYHFILLAERQEQVLPTIRSRCHAQTFVAASEANTNPLFDFFCTTDYQSPLSFLSTLDQSKITERESVELLDALLAHWIITFKQAIADDKQQDVARAEKVVARLNAAMQTLPMPGSSKLFWKNLFMQIK